MAARNGLPASMKIKACQASSQICRIMPSSSRECRRVGLSRLWSMSRMPLRGASLVRSPRPVAPTFAIGSTAEMGLAATGQHRSCPLPTQPSVGSYLQFETTVYGNTRRAVA